MRCVRCEEMMDQAQFEKLTENEQKLLSHLRKHTPADCQCDESIRDGVLSVRFLKPCARHELAVWYEGDLLVLNIGDWTHSHPESLNALTNLIDRVVTEKIVVWRVTRANGFKYSGHYDADELADQGPRFLDEPDTGVEPGDHLQKETYTQVLEDKVI